MPNTAVGARVRKARAEAGIPRCEAGPRIGVTERMLTHYEVGDTRTVPPDLIPRMADAYHDPTLGIWYCQNECPIGRERPHEADDTGSIERGILDAHMYDTGRIDDAIRNLYEVARDGIVHTWEREQFASALAEIEARSAQLWALIISAQNLAREGGGEAGGA